MNQPFSRPSMILGIAASGLPSLRVISSIVLRSASMSASGTSSRLQVLRLGEGHVQRDLVRQFLGAALHDDDDAVHAATGLGVPVGVDDLTLAGLESVDLADRDVLLQRREHLLDVLVE